MRSTRNSPSTRIKIAYIGDPTKDAKINPSKVSLGKTRRYGSSKKVNKIK